MTFGCRHGRLRVPKCDLKCAKKSPLYYLCNGNIRDIISLEKPIYMHEINWQGRLKNKHFALKIDEYQFIELVG